MTKKWDNRDLRRWRDADLLEEGADLLHEPAMRLIRLPHLAYSDALTGINTDHVIFTPLGDPLTSAEFVGYGPVLRLVWYDVVPLRDYYD
jgi:hypothetical protein